MGRLVSIVYKPHEAPSSGDRYTRVPLQRTVLVANYGIEGDAKGGGTRQLNLMSAETVEALAGKGFQTAPGELGEQLIVAGLNLDALPCGTRLRIGAEASVELTEPRTGCAKFERHQGKTKGEAAGQMGVMARVLEGGAIAIGDPVSCVDP